MAMAKFYYNSAPAHRAYPTRKVTLGQALHSTLGDPLTSNRRTINKFFDPRGAETCQLCMGMTKLEQGSLWNTMPCHTHERRMEVYFYFRLRPDAAVFHMMGEPQETRHIVVHNEQAVIFAKLVDPFRRRHASYSFIWGMVGENQTFDDMDQVRSPTCAERQEQEHMFDLSGKVAVVTGCDTGLGQGMALALAQAGCDIVGVNIVPPSETAAAVERMGRRFHDIAADLGTAAAEDVVARATAAFGRIDILVNNAGIIRRADALEFTEKDWDDVIAVNLKAVFFLAQAAARQFIRQQKRTARGRIINVASLLSFQGGIRVPSYTAAKSGVLGLTRLLANEWAKYGITVNAIAPGYMATNNTAPLRADPVRSKEILDRIPLAAGGCRRILRGRWCSWPRTPRPMSPATPWRSMVAGWHGELGRHGTQAKQASPARKRLSRSRERPSTEPRNQK